MSTTPFSDELPDDVLDSMMDFKADGDSKEAATHALDDKSVKSLASPADSGSGPRMSRKNPLADLALEMAATNTELFLLDNVRLIIDDGEIPDDPEVFARMEAELAALYKKLAPDGVPGEADIDLRDVKITKNTLPALGVKILHDELVYCHSLYDEWSTLCSRENIHSLSMATSVDFDLVFQYISNQANYAQIFNGENKAAWSALALQSTLVYMLQSDNKHLTMLGLVSAHEIEDSIHESAEYPDQGRFKVDFSHGRYGAYFAWLPNDTGDYDKGRLVINSQSFAFQSPIKRALLMAHEATHFLEASEPPDNPYELVNPVNSERSSYTIEHSVLEEHVAHGHFNELGPSEQQFLKLAAKYDIETVAHAMAIYHVGDPNLTREEILLKVAEELDS